MPTGEWGPPHREEAGPPGVGLLFPAGDRKRRRRDHTDPHAAAEALGRIRASARDTRGSRLQRRRAVSRRPGSRGAGSPRRKGEERSHDRQQKPRQRYREGSPDHFRGGPGEGSGADTRSGRGRRSRCDRRQRRFRGRARGRERWGGRVARDRPPRPETRRGCEDENRGADRDLEEARERLLRLGRRAVPRPGHQARVGSRPGRPRRGQDRARKSREGALRPAREGAQGGSAARMDSRMSGTLPTLRSAPHGANTAAPRASYRVETWGCQMNVLDGERMAGQLESRGFAPAPDGEAARIVILNTCSVREKAEDKVFSELGVLARRKQADPELVVGVTGCVAQVSGQEILERAPWVDFVAGTGQVERIGELVDAALAERRQALRLELPEEDPVYQFRQITRGSAFQAYVTVIEGCDQFCTFCIVPFTRGRERCRSAAEILEEVAELTGRGYTEVTLLGQTVNAYREPVDGFGLGELLRRVGRVDGLRRLRFITSHPRLVDEDLLDALSSVPVLAPYL